MENELPEIEVLRVGTFQPGNGAHAVTFRPEDLDAIVENYNAAGESAEAPLVVGHPQNNSPAYGWVSSLRRQGDRLLAKAKQVNDGLREAVQSGAYKKISVSLFQPAHPANPTPGKWTLRHVGFLGGAAPAVPGLKPVSFSDADDGAELATIELDFSAGGDDMPGNPPSNSGHQPAPVGNPPPADLSADLERAHAEKAALEAELAQLRAEKAERERQELANFAAELVKGGRITAALEADLVEFMAALDATTALDFSADRKETPRAFFQRLMTDKSALLDFSADPKAGADGADLVDPPAPLGGEALGHAARKLADEYAARGEHISITQAVALVQQKGA